MSEVNDLPCFLLTGPIGGYKDPHFPQPKYRGDIPWSAQCSESSVRRFLGEAKYYLKIYNTVVQHFVCILPFEKYFEEGSDRGRLKKKRDSFYAVLWNAQTLDELLNPQSGEAVAAAVAAMPEEDDAHEKIDLEVEKSFQSMREQMAKSSPSHESVKISSAGSIQDILKPSPSHGGPSLISRLKDRFTTLLDEEKAKLKQKLTLTFPEFAEKKINKINKFVAKAIDYSDYITKVENVIDTVEWPAWDGGDIRAVDLREQAHMDGANHFIYAPQHMVDDLEKIFSQAYLLLTKTKDLENVMKKKDPDEYAKLQELKENIPLPTGNDYQLDKSGNN